MTNMSLLCDECDEYLRVLSHVALLRECVSYVGFDSNQVRDYSVSVLSDWKCFGPTCPVTCSFKHYL